MKVLLDTNVVLDALLDCDPWSAAAREIWRSHVEGEIDAHVTASSVTDVFYVARRGSGRERAWEAVRVCIDHLEILPVGEVELLAALDVGGSDFEDDLQLACALASHVDAIVTRDPSGYSGATVEVLSPQELVERFA